MSSSRIGAELRRLVAARADNLCEYCLIHDGDTYAGCEVDHIISEKHGGETTAENLAFACPVCNRLKGSDVGSIGPDTHAFVRLFNPRSDRWSDHFAFGAGGLTIEPLTEIGAVTAKLLGFNRSERIDEREDLKKIGRYPPPEAASRIGLD